MLKSVLRVALVCVLCLGSVQAEGEGDQYLSMAKEAFEHEDYQQALAYFQKAADMGNAVAYFD
ncbi:hypothetical protein [Helicobacter suis]|uniref:hypothetical protein n=1 Tax=Helicobacter suis TaxID=104628 RepID=UPI0013CF99F3|nr:hypothetical protein [Helicobacter suis]